MKKGERMGEEHRRKISDAHKRLNASRTLDARSANLRKAHAVRQAQAKYRNETQAERAHRHRYGITPDQLERMWRAQNGHCAVCPRVLTRGRGGFAVDHDHEIGTVRGLLCLRCNVSLQWFESYRDAAARYLAGSTTR